MRYCYAYDGSGVPLSTRVDVIERRGPRALVSFLDFTPPLDRMTETEEGTNRWVPVKGLGEDFALASFNWLD